jgi:hypothetical protein
MYSAVSRWAWAASAVTTAFSRSTLSSSSFTCVVSVVSSGIRCCAIMTFSSATPRSHFPSIAIAVSR